MAGVELNKSTIKALGGMRSHFDEKARATHTHKNKDIDKEKSHLNYNLGCDTWREMMKACKDEIKKQDALHPPKRMKKDRKDAYSFILYCPNEIENDKKFFSDVYQKIEELYPGSLKGMQVHLDEQHEYIDPHTKQVRMSMKHAHCFGVPIDKEKGCNMKNFANRDFFTKVNQVCEEVARSMGATYHTGQGHHEDRDIDTMKVQSIKAAEEVLKEKREKIKEQDEVVDFQMTMISSLDKSIEELQEKEKGIIERIKDAIKGFMVQFDRHTEMEKITPKPRREFVFGEANKLRKLGNNEIKSIYDKVGFVDAPEGNLRQITKKYEEVLDNIEKSENEPLEEVWDIDL